MFPQGPVVNLLFFFGIAIFLLIVFWPKAGLLAMIKISLNTTLRVQQEDVLKHLVHSLLESRGATLASIAGTLGLHSNRLPKILEPLIRNGFVELKEGNLGLTAEGRAYGLRILRAHRLYEKFLSDKTGYAEIEWHDKAEQAEHSLETEQVESLSQALGNPLYDPHGDPIPDEKGNIDILRQAVTLDVLQPGEAGMICHLEDEPPAVYSQIVAEGFYLGQTLVMLEKKPDSLHFFSEEGEYRLAPLIAANISLKRVEKAGSETKDTVGLDEVQKDEPVRIVSITSKIRGMERRRIFDLGFLPSTRLSLELQSASGDPLAFRVRGALIALRRKQAREIRVVREAVHG